MNTTEAIRERILRLCGERGMTINKLANLSAVAPSSLKNILYGKSQNPKILTIKMLCDGLGISLGEFFSTPEFDQLEQEIKLKYFVSAGITPALVIFPQISSLIFGNFTLNLRSAKKSLLFRLT